MRKNAIIQWAMVAVLGAALVAVATLLRPDASLARPEASPFFPSPRPAASAAATSLLPLSALGGRIFLVFCDTLGRLLLPGGEIRVGIVTALFGAPYFLWLLCRKK